MYRELAGNDECASSGTCMMFIPARTQSQNAAINGQELAEKLEVGDIIFIRIDILPFRKIACDTGSWTNHVGIVVDTAGKEPLVAESTFPVSRIAPLSRFIRRSEAGRVAIGRLHAPISQPQRDAIKAAAIKRRGIFYDTGFNLYSKREFCSRYVREVVAEATGIELGNIENFKELFANNPDADIRFWRFWYFGRIPWQRETVTPASILRSADLQIIFDGKVDKKKAL